MRYHAFISYSHAADAHLAPALQSALRRFAKPWYVRRALRLFRDKTSLALTSALWVSIEEALSQSEFFILLASPEAGASPWVQREIDWWLAHRSVDRLLIVLTGGEMRWNQSAQRFESGDSPVLPPMLAAAFASEPLWLDLRWARTEEHLATTNPRFQDAVAEIAAPLHGRPKEDLVGDDVREHKRTKRYAWAAITSLLALFVAAVVLGVVAEVRRREAERQTRLAQEQTRIALEQTNIAQHQTRVAEDQTKVARREAQIAVARQLLAQADVARTPLAAERQLSALLGVEALRRFQALGLPSFEANVAVRRSFALLPQQYAAWTMDAAVDAVAFAEDGRRVAAATRRLSIDSWDTRTYARLSRKRSTDTSGERVAIARGGKLLAVGLTTFTGAEAYVLDAERSEPVLPRFALGKDQYVRAMALSADGSYIAAAGHDTGPVIVKHLATNTEVGRVPWSAAVALSPTGRFVAAGGGLWEIAEADGSRELRRTRIPVRESFGVEGVAFSPDGQYFARATSQVNAPRVIELWSLRSQSLIAEVGYDVPGEALAVSSRGRYVAIASRGASPLGQIVELREMATGNAVLIQTRGAPRALAFSHADSALAIGDADARVTLWKVTTLTDVARFDAAAEVRDAVFSDDGSRLTTVSRTQSPRAEVQMIARAWDVRRNREIAASRQTFQPNRHAFSADGTHLAVAGYGEVTVLDARSGRPRRRVPFAGLVARQLTLSADGRYLAVLTADRLQVWDLETMKAAASVACAPRRDEFIFEGTTPRIVLSRDGWYFATAFRRRMGRAGARERLLPFLRVWDIKAAADIFTVPLSEPVFGKESSQAALSQDGRHLAVRADDSAVDVYDLRRGRDVSARFAHQLAGFSADGRYLVTSASDVDAAPFVTSSTAGGLRYFAAGRTGGVFHIYDLTSRQEIARVNHEPGSRPLSLSRDGLYLAVLGPDGTVRVSPVDPRVLIDAACARLARNLTKEEWKRYVGDEPHEKTCRSTDLR